MGPYEMVIGIVLIVTIGKLIAARNGYSNYGLLARFRRANPDQDAEIAKLRAEHDALSRRVQTLEKLATDPAARLADDIERLRDNRI
jgi:cell division protein FtsB